MKISPTWYPSATDSYTARKGTITADRKPGTLVWQRDGGQLYVTCRACNAINDITGHQDHRYTDRLIGSCFVCTNCRTHYFFHLEGWEPPTVIACLNCGNRKRFAVGKGEVRRLRKQGWHVDTENPTHSRCPECVQAKRQK